MRATAARENVHAEEMQWSVLKTRTGRPRCPDRMATPSDAWCLHQRSRALRFAGRYREAEKLAERAWQLLPDGARVSSVEVLYNLAVLWEACGRLVESEALHRSAVAMADTLLTEGDGPALSVMALCGLAAVLRLEGRLAEAQGIAEQAVRVAVNTSEPNAYASRAHRELGNIRRDQGRFAEAETSYEAARAAISRELSDHAALARLLQCLARLEQMRGNNERAESHVRQAQRSRGPEAQFALPDDLADGWILGSIFLAGEDFDAAEPLLRLGCVAYELLIGPSSPYTLDPLEELAALLAATNRFEEATAAYRRVLEGRSAALGPTHPALATTLHDLAVLSEAAGRKEEAGELWDRAAMLLERESATGATGTAPLRGSGSSAATMPDPALRNPE